MFINDTLLFEVPYSGAADLAGIGYFFGAGDLSTYGPIASIDYVRMYDSCNNLLFDNEFNAPTQLGVPDISIRKAPNDLHTLFTSYFNQREGTNLTYSQIDSIYSSSYGIHPDKKCFTHQDSVVSTPAITDGCNNFGFIRTFVSGGSGGLMDVVQAPDGGYLAAGRTPPAMGGADAFVAKTDRKGSVLWYKSYGGMGMESFVRIRNTSDGGFIALGNTNSFSQTQGEPFLVKGSANGEVQWSRTLGAGSAYGEYAVDVIQTSDGGYAIAANYNYIPDSVKWEVIRVDTAGRFTWAVKMGGNKANNLGGLLEDRDTLVFSGLTVGSSVTGGSSNSQYDGVLMKINKTNGNIIWSKSYNINGPCNWFFDIHNTPNGYLINGAATIDFTGPDFGGDVRQVIVETDKNGNVNRIRKIPSPGVDRTGSISVYPTPDGGYISTQGEDTTIASIYFHKTNGSGSIAWSNRIRFAGDQHITRVIQNSDGSYTGAGYISRHSLLLRTDTLLKPPSTDSPETIYNSPPTYTPYTLSLSATAITSYDTLRTLTARTMPFTEATQCYNRSCPNVNTDTLFLCGHSEPVFAPVSLNSITNCSDSSFFAVSKSTVLFNNYTDSLRGNFDSSYRA